METDDLEDAEAEDKRLCSICIGELYLKTQVEQTGFLPL
jgi:hypothetical protein